MDSNDQSKFWAIVELFGHTVLAGEVSKCDIGDFVQLNIPAVGVIPEWTKMINPKAIYAITPCTETDAREKADSLKAMPVTLWDADKMIKARFAEMEEAGKIKVLPVPETEEIL